MMRDTARFKQGEYDVLIIGGGINGAAIAHVAAGQGMKVALLEKGDFGCGTSSKSTKLIHGGIRYLENYEFDLVKESLRERYIQLKSIPHLVKPIGFIIPVYKTDRRPLWKMKLGVAVYDFLSGRYCIQKHRQLRVDEVLRMVIGIRKEGLVGAVMYYDAQMDDARIVLENILSADDKGAHVANYVEVKSFLKSGEKVIGVKAGDLLNNEEFEVRASRIVCAAGPWSNILLKMDNPDATAKIRTTKGIHIVYKGQISQHAFLIPSGSDRRVFFVIPWFGNSIIGTTDTDFAGNPDEVKAEPEDIKYLLTEARRVFPGIEFGEENIITTFAGLRPLVHDIGHPSDVSRKHVIEETASGLVFVLGGKYTTYRAIAVECIKKMLKGSLAMPEMDYPLYGSGPVEMDSQEIASQHHLDKNAVESLIQKYGTRYKDVLQLIKNDFSLKERICNCSHVIKAQVIYALKVEMAQNPEDIIWRRLNLGYLDCATKKCRKAIDDLIGQMKN